MNVSGKEIIRVIVTLVLLLCMLYANFYAVRKIQQYGLEAYFYDKLLVAIDIGGMSGLKKELAKIAVQEKLKREQVLLKDFEKILPGLKDPKGYLADIVAERREKALRVRNFRLAAIWIMLGILLLRAFIFLAQRRIRKAKEDNCRALRKL